MLLNSYYDRLYQLLHLPVSPLAAYLQFATPPFCYSLRALSLSWVRLTAIHTLEYPAAMCARIDDEGVLGIDGERNDVRIRQARIDGPPVRAAISSLKYPAAICARTDDEGVLGIDGERIDTTAVKSVGLSPSCI
jgi:hypothetical protein